MKSKRLLLMLLIALIAPWAANAQDRTIVTIGEGTSTQNFPLPGNWGYQYDVFLYTPSAAPALDADCDISSIAFNVETNSTNTGAEMYIWVKDVDADYALAAATTFSEYTDGATQVYENDDFSSTSGWNTFAFSRDFSHEGGKALLVAVRSVGCTGSGGCSRSCYYTSASNTYWYKRHDDSDPGTNVSGSISGSRANIQLDLTYTGAICFSPSGLAASNLTDNSATLSWNENGSATAWVLQYGTDSEFGTYTEENVSTTPSFGLTGLTALTTYYARVKPDCDTDGSHWNTATFTTTAYAEPVGDGWSDNFEGASCGWELINGTLTNKWAWGTATNNGGTHALYISNDNGTSNAYTVSSAAMVYATKLLNFTEGKYEFTYDWMAKGEGSGDYVYDYLRVALVPASVTLNPGTSVPTGFSASALPTGWIAVDGGSCLNNVTTWQSQNVAVNVPAGNYYLVMAWRDDTSSGTNPPAAVDNVSITRMACPYDVTGLAVDANSITTSGATITWTAGEAEEWQVATKAGNGGWTILPNTYTTASATLTGLTAATTYQVRVRAYCNANDQGAWCDAITFTTECEAIDLADVDYSENFDSYTAGTGVLPVCWSRINEGTNTSYNQYPYIYSYGANSGSNCLRLYAYGTSGTSDQYAILPEMENMEGKQITLQAKAYNSGNTFKIGMMSDPTDATTFEVIGEKTLTTSYEECSFILGRGNYVAFLMEAPTSSTTFGIYIDDITIADVPTCLKPSDLAFVSATTTGATLSWTNGAATQTAWQIAYSTDPAFDPDEVTPTNVTSNPGTISGLTAATTYYAYVRANCGNDDYSDWSNAYCMFTTECEAITNLPWSENFDAYTGSTSTTAPAGYPNDQLPTCWQFLNRSENSSAYPQVFISSNSGYPVSGKCLFFKSSRTTPLYAILPEFSEDIANLQLTFTYRNEGVSTSNGQLIVGYMTDPTDATTFTEKHTCERTTTLTEQEVLFTNAPAGSYIAFKYQGGTTNNYYLSIDNVSVNYPPTCLKPTDLVFVSATTTSATLGWTAGGTETAWQIAYSTDPAFDPDEVTPTNVTSNPGIISGLTASTTYYAYVRANCGNDDYSDWSSAYVQFDTECEVIVVDATHPFTEGFDGITSGIPVCWDNSEGTTSTESYRWNYYATGYKGHCVRFNSFNNSADNTNFLKTPVMNLPQEGENLQLSFWYKNPAGGDFSVYISTDGGDTYTTALASDLTDQSEWTKKDISLREYAGNENVVIVFAGTSNWGYGDAYIYLDEVFVGMPFTKHIAAHTANGGWYLIASPLAEDVTPTVDNGFLANEFDLYQFNQAADMEWENWKAEGGHYHFNITNGRGYLYANSGDVDLTFIGEPYSGNGKIRLSKSEGVEFPGMNLVGNPFPTTAYIDRDYYTMNDGATALELVDYDGIKSIEYMEGIFVEADYDGDTLTFTTDETTVGNNKGLILNLSQGRGIVDRAIVRFGEGHKLHKFMLQDGTKMYIPQGGEDFAVVRSRNSGEVTVNFEPAEDGIYSISVDARNLIVRSLILTDKVERVNIDLLRTPTYQFKASTTDPAERFVLSYKTGTNQFKELFMAGEKSADFGFFNNGNLMIDNEGEATLQVIDVNGRVLSSETINGNASIKVDAAPGIYMLRLINGDNVKVQKVVVE